MEVEKSGRIDRIGLTCQTCDQEAAIHGEGQVSEADFASDREWGMGGVTCDCVAPL